MAFNRNFPFHYPYFKPGAGPNAVSEIETRAVADFAFDHRNIAIVFCFSPEDNLMHVWKPDDNEGKVKSHIQRGDLAAVRVHRREISQAARRAATRRRRRREKARSANGPTCNSAAGRSPPAAGGFRKSRRLRHPKAKSQRTRKSRTSRAAPSSSTHSAGLRKKRSTASSPGSRSSIPISPARRSRSAASSRFCSPIRRPSCSIRWPRSIPISCSN